jgi:hypothetical protein
MTDEFKKKIKELKKNLALPRNYVVDISKENEKQIEIDLSVASVVLRDYPIEEKP